MGAVRRGKGLGKLWVLLALIALGGFLGEASAFEAQTNDGNGVRVDAQPVQLKPGKAAVFKVWLNTHSVDLSYDMERICTLRDDQGKEYKVVKWDGAPAGGHHRSGTLEFPALEGSPQSVTLIIRGVAGVSERSFQWKL